MSSFKQSGLLFSFPDCFLAIQTQQFYFRRYHTFLKVICSFCLKVCLPVIPVSSSTGKKERTPSSQNGARNQLSLNFRPRKFLERRTKPRTRKRRRGGGGGGGEGGGERLQNWYQETVVESLMMERSPIKEQKKSIGRKIE